MSHCSHRHAAPMTGSAQNHLWHLHTLALDMEMWLLLAFGSCGYFNQVHFDSIRVSFCVFVFIYFLSYCEFGSQYPCNEISLVFSEKNNMLIGYFSPFHNL